MRSFQAGDEDVSSDPAGARPPPFRGGREPTGRRHPKDRSASTPPGWTRQSGWQQGKEAVARIGPSSLGTGIRAAHR